MNENEIDLVVAKVFSSFNKLPKSGKPSAVNEWTTLAAFVLKSKDTCDVVCLATGTSCLGANKMNRHGHRVNDSHAEVLARRAFQCYVTEQIAAVFTSTTSLPPPPSGHVNSSSMFALCQHTSKLYVKKGLQVVFVTTQTPCGDCSIFSRQEGDVHPEKRRKLNDASAATSDSAVNHTATGDTLVNDHAVTDDIYRTGAKCLPGAAVQDRLVDGVDYHVTGCLRIKPGRGDMTTSLSCSDKLSRWSILGCQGCLPMLLLAEPIYINDIIIAGCAYDVSSMKRGLVGRFNPSCPSYGVFSRHTPCLWFCDLVFQYSKKAVEELVTRTSTGATDAGATSTGACGIPAIKASFSCLVAISDGMLSNTFKCQAAVDGYKLGVTRKSQGCISSRLMICRSEMMKQFIRCLSSIPATLIPASLIRDYETDNLSRLTYAQLKSRSPYHAMWSHLLQTDIIYKQWLVKHDSFSNFHVENE